MQGVYRLANFGGDVEPGEPNPSNKMNRTVWGKLTRPATSRVVIHTFGSGFDTALAVYTGNAVNALGLVKFNDDTAVAGLPGLTSKQSLVQFDAAAGVPYSIQFGSANSAEGDISANAFVFSPEGGLSAFLTAFLGNNTWGNRDATCGTAELLLPCTSAKFIVHNSTSKTLNVISSTDLGAGVTAPAPFFLIPGEVKTAEFIFTGGFDTTTPRALAGQFTFVGKNGGVEIARTGQRALVVIENNSTGLGNVLLADVAPTVRAGRLNEGRPFVIKLTNTGTLTAIGCHARTETFAHLRTTWQRIDPNTGNELTPLNQPIVIPGGETRWLRVTVASQEARVADPEFPIDVSLDCANTDAAPLTLFNTFDISAVSVYRPAQVNVAKLAPAGDTLNVPPSGAVFKVSARNTSSTTPLKALAIYIRPFSECCDSTKQFTVTICRLASVNGACLAAPSTEVNYSAASNVTAYFKVAVQPPSGNVAFAPGLRRVFFKLWQDQPTSGSFDTVVGAESVAVKKN